MDEGLLNAGLKLAMEFGEDWLAPIQSRLAKLHPELTPAELDEYDAACRKAMNFGHEQVADCLRQAAGSQAEARRRFEDLVRSQFDWIDDANLAHLFSQGCYYAWKNGEMP